MVPMNSIIPSPVNTTLCTIFFVNDEEFERIVRLLQIFAVVNMVFLRRGLSPF